MIVNCKSVSILDGTQQCPDLLGKQTPMLYDILFVLQEQWLQYSLLALMIHREIGLNKVTIDHTLLNLRQAISLELSRLDTVDSDRMFGRLFQGSLKKGKETMDGGCDRCELTYRATISTEENMLFCEVILHIL